MQRYLIQFNYFGSRFQGLQKQLFRRKIEGMTEAEVQTMYEKDERTVQGALESAVWNIVKPSNPVKLVTSSRTDKGVHALLNTAHVDLHPSTATGKYFPPAEITKMVNLWMIKKDLDIRVRKTMAVPPTFHSRINVARRSYLYRMAVVPEVIDAGTNTWTELPFKNVHRRSRANEYNRCILSKLALNERGRYWEFNLKDGEVFDLELFKETLKLMEGVHDFTNFCNPTSHFHCIYVDGKRNTKVRKTVAEMTKEVFRTEVFHQHPPLPDFLYPAYGESGIQFIDILIEGKSFLHNQVRRMIGAATSVATNKISIDYVRNILEVPYISWDYKIHVGNSSGLYLANIEYKEGVLDLATDNYQDMLNLEKISVSDTEVISMDVFNNDETSFYNALSEETS